ncbi:hypothetical protein [Nocardia cyriacigeorgica]|uniref:Uncharacterized protein n=1 Tax=Nocardia cyriacigeorgica TaxID=135487 RepID=A0A5R8NZT8_9NOCA|nr:hypothetical protein [Nocardia cyriacigeorgica]TLF82439.1 hypothetical protein FEK34_01455 [Nocardia cyriacigeorgica]
MRVSPPTDDELRQNFEEMLASVCSGGGLRSATGLDMKTEDALWAIARAHPEVPDDLVAAARAAFAGQLDGTNARERREALARKIEELDRRGQTR